MNGLPHTVNDNVFKSLVEELSKINPIEYNPDEGESCFFCRTDTDSHSPDCLYLRACQAIKLKDI